MPLLPFAKASDVQTLSPGVTDDLAQLAVELVSGRIRDYVHWDVDQKVNATYTRLFRQRQISGPLGGLDPALGGYDRTDTLSRTNPSVVLPCTNLTSVASVTVDDRLLLANQWDATVSGIVYLNGVWPSRKIVVVYTAGWVRYPEDEAPTVFRDVCLQVATELASNPERLRSYTMGGDSETFALPGGRDGVTEDPMSRLDVYRVDQ